MIEHATSKYDVTHESNRRIDGLHYYYYHRQAALVTSAIRHQVAVTAT